MDFSAGHDDQILADPERLGVVRPLSEAYMTGSSRFFIRWDDTWRSDRVDLVAEAEGTTYGSKVDGGDGQLRLTGAYRKRFTDTWVLDASGSTTRFRRDHRTSPNPVFNYDLQRLNARVGAAPSREWLATLGMQYNWFGFPGRFLPADSTVANPDNESQRQFSLSMAVVRRLGRREFLTGEVLYRRTNSNLPIAEYDGPLVSLRSRTEFTRGIVVSSFASFGRRNYDSFPSADSLEVRHDETWQLGVTVEHPISDQVRLFLDGSYLHQVSNVGDFAFNQSRIALGVAMSLISTAAPPDLEVAVSRLAPQPVPGGVRFRYENPRAREVFLVGGFNDWDATATPMVQLDDRGLWEVVIPLPRGVWRYAFVVDGVWTRPPEAHRYEADGFGGENGVYEVPVPKEDNSVTGVENSRPSR